MLSRPALRRSRGWDDSNSRRLPAELRSIVAGNEWASVVRFDEQSRWYMRLGAPDEFEAWLLSWLPGQRTGLHGHGESSGGFTVVQGSLTEVVPFPGASRVLSTQPAFVLTSHTVLLGQTMFFRRGHIHELVNERDESAISIHLYTPELTVMERYEMHPQRGLVETGKDLAGVDW